jgi:uncharacterized membrane protein
MKEELPAEVQVAIGLMVMWGIFGLVRGDGFFGGILLQIDAIGDIVSLVLKGALFFGVIWFISSLFKKKDKDE